MKEDEMDWPGSDIEDVPASDVWPAVTPKGEWQEYGWETHFYLKSWRARLRAVWMILRAERLAFSVKITLRNEGDVTYLEAPELRLADSVR